MDRKKLMLLVGALIVAIGTAFMARSIFAGAGAPQADAAQLEPKGPKVLVAQRALPVGTIITADSVAYQAWPKDMVQDAYYLNGEADVSKLLGTVVRFAITAGEPVTQGALVAPGDRGFLAAALGPGMRAVTVPVSAKTGVAGFVFPGDHVDLVLTQTIRAEEGEPLRASETIMRNLRVLATDQSTETEKVDGKTVVRAFKTVTLEVTPKIAEKIAVAQTIGTLSLSLRAIADNQGELERAIASGDVSIPAGASREEEEKLLKTALSRPMDKGGSYVTGGDVSRFQRRSAPVSKDQLAREFARSAGQAAGSAVANGQGAIVIGPVVRVTRGKETQVVPVRGK
ncbi:MAG: Flp pilus assembly protein CpaB [Novosphingobium sp.]|nr:Flp pilus assembly protein CpaB [Novosphingobium sp.]